VIAMPDNPAVELQELTKSFRVGRSTGRGIAARFGVFG
jgi:hypothetical protein